MRPAGVGEGVGAADATTGGTETCVWLIEGGRTGGSGGGGGSASSESSVNVAAMDALGSVRGTSERKAAGGGGGGTLAASAGGGVLWILRRTSFRPFGGPKPESCEDMTAPPRA
jgi:hypothetical protein